MDQSFEIVNVSQMQEQIRRIMSSGLFSSPCILVVSSGNVATDLDALLPSEDVLTLWDMQGATQLAKFGLIASPIDVLASARLRRWWPSGLLDTATTLEINPSELNSMPWVLVTSALRHYVKAARKLQADRVKTKWPAAAARKTQLTRKQLGITEILHVCKMSRKPTSEEDKEEEEEEEEEKDKKKKTQKSTAQKRYLSTRVFLQRRTIAQTKQENSPFDTTVLIGTSANKATATLAQHGYIVVRHVKSSLWPPNVTDYAPTNKRPIVHVQVDADEGGAGEGKVIQVLRQIVGN